jgi:hypothetical protein
MHWTLLVHPFPHSLALYAQEPLRQRYRYQPRFTKAVLHSCLERIGATELGIYNDEADGPIDDDSKTNEEDGAGDEACIPESIGLANDASASALH